MDERNYEKLRNLRELRAKMPGSTAALSIFAALVIVVAIMVTVRVDEVAGTEIGLLVNNITGNVEVVSTGKKIYNGLYHSFYTLDKTEQKLEMTLDKGDRVRIKTKDGSDVNLDLIIQYRINPEQVRKVALDSGLEPASESDWYKLKWARDYSRSICRSIFGELSTEEFYNTVLRNAKADESLIDLNSRLNEHGIVVTSVIPGDFNFYAEYETKIQEKKLADQEVQEQQSKANAALQDQIRQEVEAEKVKEVAIAEFKGQMQELIVAAKADAERMLRTAEAYAIETQAGADAEYYKREKNASIITAKTTAEATGIEKMCEALIGEGGFNIVKMEYAKRIQEMTVSGQPFTLDGRTQRFGHISEDGKSGETAKEVTRDTAGAESGDSAQ